MSVVVEDALARALRVLQEATENVDGASFVEALVRGLAQAFAADFTLMGEVDADDPSILRPLAAWARGAPTVFAPYLLAGTPCADVIAGGEICVFPRGVQGCFPDDHVLAEIGGESYVGVAVRGRDGTIVGLLAAIASTPRSDFAELAPALVAFTSKVAWMIERGRLELHLRRSLGRSRALTRIATNMHAALVRPDETFLQMCGEVRTVLDVSAVSVTMIDAHGGFDRRAQVGLPQAWLDDPPPVSLQWLDDHLPVGEGGGVRAGGHGCVWAGVDGPPGGAVVDGGGGVTPRGGVGRVHRGAAVRRRPGADTRRPRVARCGGRAAGPGGRRRPLAGGATSQRAALSADRDDHARGGVDGRRPAAHELRQSADGGHGRLQGRGDARPPAP